jgi:hypothetical protein
MTKGNVGNKEDTGRRALEMAEFQYINLSTGSKH